MATAAVGEAKGVWSGHVKASLREPEEGTGLSVSGSGPEGRKRISADGGTVDVVVKDVEGGVGGDVRLRPILPFGTKGRIFVPMLKLVKDLQQTV